MPPTKQDLIDAYRRNTERVEALAGRLSDQDLESRTYEGWTAGDVLRHLASTAASAVFFIATAQSGRGGTEFDIDTWNAEQVASRRGKAVRETVAELRAGHETSIKAVEDASAELMAKQVPNFEGGMSSVAELIQGAATGHEATHLDDLERMLRA